MTTREIKGIPDADLAGVTTDQIVATYNQIKQVDQYFKIGDHKKEINAIFSALIKKTPTTGEELGL